MNKIMLVIENEAERKFLKKMLNLLDYKVIAITKGMALSDQLLDHFPDVVIAATLGKNQKILVALTKIKKARGKPKVVFVRQERETEALTPDQKSVIDGVLYSPIDPFKLLIVLSEVTSSSLPDLKEKYKIIMSGEKGKPETKEKTEISDKIEVKGESEISDNVEVIQASGKSLKKTGCGIILIDSKRRDKYNLICGNLEKEKFDIPVFNGNKMREMQKKQMAEHKEDPTFREQRKHFLKTLFSIDPLKIKKG